MHRPNDIKNTKINLYEKKINYFNARYDNDPLYMTSNKFDIQTYTTIAEVSKNGKMLYEFSDQTYSVSLGEIIIK